MTLRYTDDRKELVKMARAKGMTDVEILKDIWPTSSATGMA